MPVLPFLRMIAADCQRIQVAQVHGVCAIHRPAPSRLGV